MQANNQLDMCSRQGSLSRTSLHRKQIYNLLLLLVFIVMTGRVDALINVPVSQKSQFIDFIQKDTHAYFDISYEGQGNLIQADNNATYMFSKISQRSANRYQFVSITHRFQNPVKVYDTIILDGYQVFGLCQFNGSLDYVVALDIASNELRVIRFLFDKKSASINDYKTVDKDDKYKKLTGTVYVDCSYESTYKGVNTYVIGIAGTYFHPNQISSYYLAKFNTKYNFTEYMILSEDQEVMEAARGVKVDLDNKMIYLAVEINKQKYHQRTVYQPGDAPGEDNSNVAIHGYSWQHGVRLWTTVIGNVKFTDKFSRMDHWGNYLYVFLNSYSTEYSTTSNYDIYYYRIRALNGVIEVQKIFGSPYDDKILDLRITFNGLYVLAYMNNQLLPHKFNDRIWQTQNNAANVALIWMDFDDDILDIEGYDLKNLPFTNYPQKLFVPRIGNASSTMQTFVFVSPRSNAEIDQNGGFYVTYLADSQNLFYQTMGCGDTCKKCSSQVPSKCIECKWSPFVEYQHYKHTCYLKYQCPDFTYNVYDHQDKLLLFCKDCHYSCKNCTGPHKDQCTQCCQDNQCGPIKNRVPNLGTCSCPPGLADSNGYCVQRCVMNLAGKRGDFCYTRCPDNSLPDVRFDQPTQAQERSQYDGASQTDCTQSMYHLKFTSGNSGEGKGLAIKGPPDMSGVPSEFTMAVWVRPQILLSKSYFVSAFNRVYVLSSAANKKVQFIYKAGPGNTPADIIEPIYDENSRVIEINAWNYISISMRTYLDKNVEKYEQIIAIAITNMGTVVQAGYDNSKPVKSYTSFSNTIYLGAYNDNEPQSFTGFMKEFKLFTKFHGFKQMQDEQLRMYRYYSYDDPNLVAYWKLSEAYQPTDIEYTILDYSINQNSITYSKVSKPLYPQYIFDQSFALSLCIFHDVAVCKSVDYSSTHPHVVTQRRINQAPTFNLKDLTHIRSDFDQIWYVPNNTKCVHENMLAYLEFKANPVYQWFLRNDNYNPSINLTMGNHYQVCYYINELKQAFNLYQVYLIASPQTIDPSTNDAFMTDGVSRTWLSSGGDQGYMDTIKFSLDCDHTIQQDYEMQRSMKPSYGQHFMKNFTFPGEYYFCWMPSYVQETDMPYYHPVHDLKFKIVSVPTVDTSSVTFVHANEDMVRYDLQGAFVEGDMIRVSWRGLILADCNPDNFIGDTFLRNYSYWPSFWFGYQTGIYGIKNNTMDDLHLCYMSRARDAPQAWSRIKKTTGTSYFVKVLEYTDPWNLKCPELVGFYPQYGSTELYETDTVIKFWFNNQQVFPSRDSTNAYGKIVIFRGALRPDGRIIKTTDVLWKNDKMTDTGVVNPLQQGDLLCSGFGQCTIVLSTKSSRMQGGEIYFLTFYRETFAYKLTKDSLTRYYLFNNKVLDLGEDSAYDHMFFCRSFNVTYSDQKINGRQFSMQGVDLRYKVINQVLTLGKPTSALFQTKAINLHMRVSNTLDTYCTSNSPQATVNMEDVFQTNFTVYNLELRQCNEGVLYTDVELVRGIQDQYGVFTHVRSEWHKNIKIGDIGCHESCRFCNGTKDKDCIVCQDSLPYLAEGRCYPKCPSYAPYYMQNIMIFQKKKWNAPYCIPDCPLGYYPDPITKQCLECNLDCQTCNRQEIRSCITCKPVKYFYSGLCVEDCPQPHHKNNFSSYRCEEVSKTKYLQVKIQSLGYKLKIPKDQQTYLRVEINNEGGGDIMTIQWEQLEPYADSLDMLVFTVSSDGEKDDKSQTIRLKMTALNYIAATQVVKIKCTVTNSIGEIAYDIYEFFQNAPPDQLALGATTIFTQYGAPGKGNGTTGDTIWRINATNWQDPDYINFKVFMIVDQKYITLSDQVSQKLPENVPTIMYFRIPLISDSATVKEKKIQLCLLATDYHFATAQKCIVLTNLVNNVNYVTDLNLLRNQLYNLTYEGNLTNAVYAAQMMYQVMKSAKRPQSSPGICSLDYHCNGQGRCSSLLGNQRCVCNLGYSGTFCQFKGLELNDYTKITSKIIDALYNKLQIVPEITSNEIEMVAVIIRGILKDPDVVDDAKFEKIVQMLEMVGDASTFAHYPLTIDLRDAYMDTLTAAMNKLFHSYKVQRAITNVVKLSKQESIVDQYTFMASQQRLRRMLQATTVTTSTSTEALIGGVDERYAKLHSTQDASMEGPLYQRWGRRLDEQVNIFIQMFLPKLNPIYPTYSYSSNVFQLLVESRQATEFKDKSIFIKEKDVTWYLPPSVFDNAQGRASDKHEVNLKVMKYLANPFFFEKEPGAFVETNVTELTFYDSGGNHINITLTNDKEYIIITEPYIKSQGYERELLRCMSWDEDNNEFQNDGTCSYNMIYSLVPCLTCEEGYQPNLTVSLCRCKHLSRFATVYTQTLPQRGRGPQIGLYVNFESMNFWNTSFGFYMSLMGSGVYFLGLLIFLLIDHYTVPKILARMIARVKRLELKGFKQKEAKKLTVYRDEKGKIVFIRHQAKKKDGETGKEIEQPGGENNDQSKNDGEVDKVVELKKGALDGNYEESNLKAEGGKGKKKFADEENVAEAFLNGGGGKKKAASKKTFKEEEDGVAEVVKGGKKGQAEEDEDNTGPKEESKEGQQEEGYFNEQGEWVEGSNNNYGEEEEEEQEEDPEVAAAKKRAENDLLEQQMQAKWEEEKEVLDFVKQHGTSSSEEDKAEKNRNKEQKMYLKLERKAKERYWYNLKSMVIHGNGLLSLLLINSMLMPRHVRFTMFFTNIMLNFFWCALIIKNSRQELLLPDSGSTAPSDLAQNDLWISIASPMGTTIVMYVFAGLFKISDARLNHSYTMVYLEQMLVELKKEMRMKFIVAYSITLAVYAAIFWYVIKFTSAFGWQVSWVWWYSGCFAILIQYFGVDLGVSFIHWIVHWCSRNLSIFWMEIRMVKMCRQEA